MAEPTGDLPKLEEKREAPPEVPEAKPEVKKEIGTQEKLDESGEMHRAFIERLTGETIDDGKKRFDEAGESGEKLGLTQEAIKDTAERTETPKKLEEVANKINNAAETAEVAIDAYTKRLLQVTIPDLERGLKLNQADLERTQAEISQGLDVKENEVYLKQLQERIQTFQRALEIKTATPQDTADNLSDDLTKVEMKDAELSIKRDQLLKSRDAKIKEWKESGQPPEIINREINGIKTVTDRELDQLEKEKKELWNQNREIQRRLNELGRQGVKIKAYEEAEKVEVKEVPLAQKTKEILTRLDREESKILEIRDEKGVAIATMESPTRLQGIQKTIESGLYLDALDSLEAMRGDVETEQLLTDDPKEKQRLTSELEEYRKVIASVSREAYKGRKDYKEVMTSNEIIRFFENPDILADLKTVKADTERLKMEIRAGVPGYASSLVEGLIYKYKDERNYPWRWESSKDESIITKLLNDTRNIRDVLVGWRSK